MATQQEDIFDVSSDILDVDALKNISVNAKEEEILNLKSNLKALSDEKADIKLPYPDVGPFDTGSDYDEMVNLQYQKRCNQPLWDKIEEVNRYLDVDSLYNGHLSCINGREYYFVDSFLSSKLLKNDNILISVNDATYNEIFKKWKFPKKGEEIRFSRNIDIRNKQVDDVTIIYDDSNAVFSSISDLFLRNTLIKNKSNNYIQNIIQTIQEKQNEIRTYDGNSSIVVQGCAGSGKTMVLLHRFKYLKYNNFVNDDNYALLVPNENFKEFIKTTASEFGIYEENVYTYAEYYRYILSDKNNVKSKKKGKSKKWEEANELNFPEEYLSFVYSEDFIKECYSYLSEFSCKIINSAIDFCDEKLSALISDEKKQIIETIDKIKDEFIKKINLLLFKIPFMEERFPIKKYSDLEEVIGFIEKKHDEIIKDINRKTYLLRNEKLPEALVELVEETDFELVGIRSEIVDEENKYNKATIFTKIPHKLKLNSLKVKYETKRKEVIDNLYKKRQNENEKKIAELNFIDGKLSVEEFGNLVKEIKNEYEISKKQISDCDIKIDQYDKQFSEKYKDGIKALQQLIGISSEAEVCYSESVRLLKQCGYLPFYTSLALRTVKIFQSYECNTEIKISEIVESAIKSNIDMYQLLFGEIFGRAKNIIRQKFNVKICESYKHYWLLQLYFSYLLNGISSAKEYLFIDEAQDLSPLEIDLLSKLNMLNHRTICNLFGDVNQVISNYGVKNWEQFLFIDKYFVLDENFRNTNQIIEYCKENINFSMKPVGVSMNPVREFCCVDEVLAINIQDMIFIVKDEYAAGDLSRLLEQKGVLDYKVFAVKEIKGLEFKQIIVFDDDMTANEKYISYTRALIQLYVVKNSPWSGKKRVRKIIQDDD